MFLNNSWATFKKLWLFFIPAERRRKKNVDLYVELLCKLFMENKVSFQYNNITIMQGVPLNMSDIGTSDPFRDAKLFKKEAVLFWGLSKITVFFQHRYFETLGKNSLFTL